MMALDVVVVGAGIGGAVREFGILDSQGVLVTFYECASDQSADSLSR